MGCWWKNMSVLFCIVHNVYSPVEAIQTGFSLFHAHMYRHVVNNTFNKRATFIKKCLLKKLDQWASSIISDPYTVYRRLYSINKHNFSSDIDTEIFSVIYNFFHWACLALNLTEGYYQEHKFKTDHQVYNILPIFYGMLCWPLEQKHF